MIKGAWLKLAHAEVGQGLPLIKSPNVHTDICRLEKRCLETATSREQRMHGWVYGCSGRSTWPTRHRRRHLTPTAIGPFWRVLGLARGKGHRGEETQTESADFRGSAGRYVARPLRSGPKEKETSKGNNKMSGFDHCHEIGWSQMYESKPGSVLSSPRSWRAS